MNTPTPRGDKARKALAHLKEARNLLDAIGAKKATNRVRLAITSAGGAIRHADRLDAKDERFREQLEKLGL